MICDCFLNEKNEDISDALEAVEAKDKDKICRGSVACSLRSERTKGRKGRLVAREDNGRKPRKVSETCSARENFVQKFWWPSTASQGE